MESGSSTSGYQKITMIINPVAGLQSEAQRIIHEYFDARPHIQVTYYETTPDLGAGHFAKKALEAGDTQLIAAYGGDGTMAEVSAVLHGSGIPLGILPGGTANVMAVELGVPLDLTQALDLLFEQPHQVRVVDMGSIDNQPFLLRSSLGYEAEFSATAPRAAKRERGRLAYFEHAFSLLRGLRQARYIVTAEGQPHVVRGITCLICNSTNVGMTNVQLVHHTDVSDGLLDVIVIESVRIGSIMRIVSSIVQGLLPQRMRREAKPAVHHWQVKEVTVEVRPAQMVAYDGELLKSGAKRVSAKAIPQAVGIVVPAPPEENTTTTTEE